MRFAQPPGYSPSFPVTYGNLYGDGNITTAGFSDPFNMRRVDKVQHCPYVVAYNGIEKPQFQLNNPAYMREVDRSHSDPLPPVELSRNPTQNNLLGIYGARS
jgi:hypothetical protein